MSRKQMKIVRLIEPDLCIGCRFAEKATVENDRGEVQKMVYCKRLDCDNWDVLTFEPAHNVQLENGDEAA